MSDGATDAGASPDAREALQARLAAARQRTKAAADAVAASVDTLTAEVEAAERDASDAEAVAACVSRYGALGSKIAAVYTDQGVVIVQRPNGVAMKAFQDLEAPRMQDVEVLVRPCVVYPARDKFDAMIADQPVILTRCSSAVVELAGAKRKESTGKY